MFSDLAIDGVSQWAALNEDEASARTEFVYNLDERIGLSAIRWVISTLSYNSRLR